MTHFDEANSSCEEALGVLDWAGDILTIDRRRSMGKKKTTGTQDRLKEIEGRLRRLENLVHKEARETPAAPWRFLVRRHHPWRKQLYLKGRNLTARQLVGSIKANQMDEETAAKNYHLPLDAIKEALAYVEKNLDLLQTEAEIERLMHKRGGARAPQTVS